MDILIQVIGYCFIPLMLIVIISGFNEIYRGLKEHFAFQGFKIYEFSFDQRVNDFKAKFVFRKMNTNFCKG